MHFPHSRRCAVAMLLAIAASPALGQAQELAPIRYTMKVPDPASRIADIEAVIPTGGVATVDLMMPVWSPGFYVKEDYTRRIQGLAAKSPDGKELKLEKTANHWKVETGGAASIILTYKLNGAGGGVTGTAIGPDMAIINPGSTFITLAEKAKRPHDVYIEMPDVWKQSITGMDDAPDGKPNHYRAEDFETMVDCPIIAGTLIINEFELHGKKHYVADIGAVGKWDSKGVAENLKKIVEQDFQLFGELPYKKYVFLNVFRGGAGGLEHKNSCLLSSAANPQNPTPGGDKRWLSYVSHEFFHGYNIKRLRPIELGPFDFDTTPRTSGLWVGEGLSVYFQGLMCSRAGVMTPEDYLASLSGNINNLQTTPGRLVQTLSKSSLDIFASGGSGVGGDRTKTISYYVKGPVVGFLLDAKIQKATNGAKSLDNFMRIAYERFGKEKGFTPEDLVKLAEEVAGTDMKAFFKSALDSTDELDYTEALEWYGLRFKPTDDPTKPSWNLEARPDATEAQKARVLKFAGPRPPK